MGLDQTTYSRNGPRERKNSHRRSHCAPAMTLDNSTGNYRPKKCTCRHGAVEQRESLSVSSARTEGIGIGSFFLLHDGGEIGSNRGYD